MRHVTVIFTLRTFSFDIYWPLWYPLPDHVDFLSNSVPWMPAMKNQEYIYALTQERDFYSWE